MHSLAYPIEGLMADDRRTRPHHFVIKRAERRIWIASSAVKCAIVCAHICRFGVTIGDGAPEARGSVWTTALNASRTPDGSRVTALGFLAHLGARTAPSGATQPVHYLAACRHCATCRARQQIGRDPCSAAGDCRSPGHGPGSRSAVTWSAATGPGSAAGTPLPP